MTTVVAKTQRTILPADERYKDAMDALHEALGDGVAFAHAQAWAIEQCGKAEHYDWSVSNRFKEEFEEKWDSASRAALRLAEHLESGGLFGTQRIIQAEEKIGLKLKFDSGEPNDASADGTPRRVEHERHLTLETAFPKLLRALSRQPAPRRKAAAATEAGRFQYAGRKRYFCGPLMITVRERTRRPSRTQALALALSYGFRKINECVEDGYPIEVVGRYYGIRMEGGKPCYEAAALFANLTFSDEKPTSEDAITKYLKRNRGSVMYWGFK